jgi:hypothetical protein
VPGAEKVRYRGKVYYKGEFKAIGLKFDLCYFMPDGRTVVLHQEKVMRHVFDSLAGERMAFTWAYDWKRVEGGLMAVAYDTRRTRKVVRDAEDDIAPLIEQTTHFVVGIDVNDRFTVRAFAACPEEKSAQTLARWARSQLAEGMASLEQKKGDKLDPMADRLARSLFEQARIAQHGTKASLRMQAEITAADLGKMLTSFSMSSK